MSGRTPFAGLEILAPGDLLSTDGFRFQFVNPSIIDRLLHIGAVLHRHDEHAAVPNPAEEPEAKTKTTGGTIPAGLNLSVGYTWVDEEEGETLLSPVKTVATTGALADPAVPPTAVLDNTAGALLVSNYDYAVTVADGLGGETAISPSVGIAVTPSEHAQVKLSGLKGILEEVAPGIAGASWRVWRRQNGGVWYLIGQGKTATLVDNGALAGDCTVSPPRESTALGTATLEAKVNAAAPDHATAFRLYVSLDGSFTNPCLIAQYPLSELKKMIVLHALALAAGAPPLVTLSFPGAHKIDPETEILSFPWKKAVATEGDLPTEGNEDGDTRETLDTHALWTWDAEKGEWGAVTSGGGGGSGVRIENAAGTTLPAEPKLQFTGSGVTVTMDEAHNRIVVTIAGPGGGEAVVEGEEGGEGGAGKPADAQIQGEVNLPGGAPGTNEKLPVNVVDWDDEKWWDAVNHRWVPQQEGIYLVTVAFAGAEAVNSGSFTDILAAKNGVALANVFSRQQSVSSSYGPEGGGVGLVHMNGTTDYLEIWGGTPGPGFGGAEHIKGTAYLGIAAVDVTGKEGKEGKAGPVGIIWQGPWKAGSAYPARSVVQRNGTAYITAAGAPAGVDPVDPNEVSNGSADFGGEEPTTTGGAAVAVSEEQAHDGTKSFKVTTSAGSEHSGVEFACAPIASGEPARGQAWVFSAAGGVHARIALMHEGEVVVEEEVLLVKGWNLLTVSTNSAGKTVNNLRVDTGGHKVATTLYVDGVGAFPNRWEILAGAAAILGGGGSSGGTESHTFSVPHGVEPQTIAGFPVYIGEGESTQKIVRVMAQCVGGGTVVISLLRNGVAIPGLTSIEVGSGMVEVPFTTNKKAEEEGTPAAINLASGDSIDLVVESSTTAEDLKVGVFVEKS